MLKSNKVKITTILVKDVYGQQQNIYAESANKNFGYQAPLYMFNEKTSCFAYMFASRKDAKTFQSLIPKTHCSKITETSINHKDWRKDLSQEIEVFAPELYLIERSLTV
jgi:hypothetical protein